MLGSLSRLLEQLSRPSRLAPPQLDLSEEGKCLRFLDRLACINSRLRSFGLQSGLLEPPPTERQRALSSPSKHLETFLSTHQVGEFP
jgi:hypothetical protein